MKHKRFRDYGFSVGLLPIGEQNSITDVPGVLVGHASVLSGDDIRTGVTIIDPGVADLYHQKLPAAVMVGNGFGKLAGSTQVEELGIIEAPIGLTNTHSVGPVLRGIIDVVIEQTPALKMPESINVVVGECNDSKVNDFYSNAVDGSHVREAFSKISKTVIEGSVGAGVGTRCFSWKGGIGTASRKVVINGSAYNLGALLQTNFGGSLTIQGVAIGEILKKNDFTIEQVHDGSCIIVIATDAPVSARQLRRIASRAFVGLARVGSILANGSGDYAIAFSTNRAGLETSAEACLSDDQLNNFFLAAAEVVEESVYNALFTAEAVSGRDGNVLESLPVAEVVEHLRTRAHI